MPKFCAPNLVNLKISLDLTTFGFLMWVKQCHKPPMTGNGLYHLFMVMTGGWFMALFYPHQGSNLNIPVPRRRLHETSQQFTAKKWLTSTSEQSPNILLAKYLIGLCGLGVPPSAFVKSIEIHAWTCYQPIAVNPPFSEWHPLFPSW